MNTRKERLNQAYDYLRENFGVHTKKDLAVAIELTQPALYSAFGGNETYLTDNLFRRICYAFPKVFNIDYLLTGNGSLLLSSPDPEPEPTREPSQPVIDHSSLVNAAIAAKDGEIAALKACIRNKDEIIQMKDETIALLEKQIRLLERDRMIDNFPPIPMGVSEPITKPKK